MQGKEVMVTGRVLGSGSLDVQQIWVMMKPKGAGWPRWKGGVIGESFRVLNGH